MFQSICATIITNIQKSLGKGSGWIVLLVFQSVIFSWKQLYKTT